MITMTRISLWERVLEALIPARRDGRAARLKEDIRWLMDHPEAPCVIDGTLVPNGYGLDANLMGCRRNLMESDGPR